MSWEKVWNWVGMAVDENKLKLDDVKCGDHVDDSIRHNRKQCYDDRHCRDDSMWKQLQLLPWLPLGQMRSCVQFDEDSDCYS